MNILIAIASCEAHAERAKVCVETWAKTWDGPYYMQRGLAPDQAAIYNEPINLCVHVFDGRKLNVGDEYKDLPAKIQAICGWALKRKYGWLLKVDTDTFVWIDRIMASGFEKFDYRGWTHEPTPPEEQYASGGAGYWLSAKAMRVIAEAELTDDTCEDRWVGAVLYKAGIIVHRDTRYAHGEERLPFEDKTLVTYHPASPKRMRELYEASR